MKDKISIIADHYGFPKQSRQLSEECAELIQAVSKYYRFRNSKNIKDEIRKEINFITVSNVQEVFEKAIKF